MSEETEDEGTERQGTEGPYSSSSSIFVQLREEESWWGRLSIVGTYILRRMEEVGEGVAWIIGIDESKFQYIISEFPSITPL